MQNILEICYGDQNMCASIRWIEGHWKFSNAIQWNRTSMAYAPVVNLTINIEFVVTAP